MAGQEPSAKLNQPSASWSLASGPVRIAFIYAAFASLWILVSDHLVGMLGLSASQLVVAGTLKGWVFVAVTTALLYRLIAGLADDIHRAHVDTAREEAEKRRAAGLLAAIAETSTDCIFAKDTAGRYLLFNPEAARFVGKPAEAVLGRDDRAIFPPADAATIMAEDRTVMEGGVPRTFEERITAPHGVRTVLATKGPIRDETGRLTGLFGITRDITERVAAEESLREKNAQLAQSNADLEQFAYVASHDLREPLRMVSTYVDLLERRYGHALDAEGHEFIGFAREGARRLDHMVLDLLEYSRVGSHKEPFQPVALDDVVAAARFNLAAALEDAGCIFSVASELPVVAGSAGELVRLFQNLIGNALKYRHPEREPVITVSVEAEGGEWVIGVADNGIGIDPAYFDKIFQIFQRLHTRERYEGTGIGLAICRRIVLHHGGRIWVESAPGQGSTFRFTLPRTT